MTRDDAFDGLEALCRAVFVGEEEYATELAGRIVDGLTEYAAEEALARLDAMLEAREKREKDDEQ